MDDDWDKISRTPMASSNARHIKTGDPETDAHDQKIIDAMSEVMADVGQPCTDEYLLKLGKMFLAEMADD